MDVNPYLAFRGISVGGELSCGSRARTNEPEYVPTYFCRFGLPANRAGLADCVLGFENRTEGSQTREMGEQERRTWGGEEPCHVGARLAYFALRRNKRPYPRSPLAAGEQSSFARTGSLCTLVSSGTSKKDTLGLSGPFVRTSSSFRCWQTLGRARVSRARLRDSERRGIGESDSPARYSYANVDVCAARRRQLCSNRFRRLHRLGARHPPTRLFRPAARMTARGVSVLPPEHNLRPRLYAVCPARITREVAFEVNVVCTASSPANTGVQLIFQYL